MENNDLLFNCFYRFADYLEKNNSQILVKIKDEKIVFNYQSDDNIFDDSIFYQVWSSFNFHSLKEEIEYFFFGSKTLILMSVFEWFCYIDLLKPFGKPCCLEELVIKMDLMGI
jgi:hypothetical protein